MFCANCGLPQLRVSAELLEEADGNTSVQVHASAISQSVEWPLLLRLCAFASLAGVFLSILLPGALTSGAGGPLVLFLFPVLTLATGLLYLRQRPLHRMSAGLGARIGSVISLFVMAGVSILSAVMGFIGRYHAHSRVVEQQLDVQIAQFEAQVRGMAAGQSADVLLAIMHTPEWRAGMFLWVQLFAAFLLLAAGSLFGALAGALLAARQRRNQSAR